MHSIGKNGENLIKLNQLSQVDIRPFRKTLHEFITPQALLHSSVPISKTRLWQELPEAMSPAYALHDKILHEAIEANRVYVFQIVGDSF